MNIEGAIVDSSTIANIKHAFKFINMDTHGNIQALSREHRESKGANDRQRGER